MIQGAAKQSAVTRSRKAGLATFTPAALRSFRFIRTSEAEKLGPSPGEALLISLRPLRRRHGRRELERAATGAALHVLVISSMVGRNPHAANRRWAGSLPIIVDRTIRGAPRRSS